MTSKPSHALSWGLFSRNQLPYLELQRPFILGTTEAKWQPTLTHFFVRVCADKGLLQRLYTENTDGLDQVLCLVLDIASLYFFHRYVYSLVGARVCMLEYTLRVLVVQHT